jgi:multidrug efflux pump subunit AcrB
VRSSTGALVPLDTMTKMTKQVRPASISQFGQLPATTISFNLKACLSLGQAADQVDAAIRDLRLPPGMLSS